MSVVPTDDVPAAAAGVPIEGLPFYNEKSRLIAMYGGSLFGCATDPMGCLFGLFCYPCAVGKVGALAGFNGQSGLGSASVEVRSKMNVGCCICTILGCLLPCGWRGVACGAQARQHLELRLALKHPGKARQRCCDDLCCHCCCPCLAVSQEMRAVKKYNELYPGNTGSPPCEAEMER